MPLVNSCASNETAPIIKTVYVCPDLYFPKFPDPAPIIPLDENCKRVTDNDTDIEYYLVPKFYGDLILNYKLDLDDTKNYYNSFKHNLNKAENNN